MKNHVHLDLSRKILVFKQIQYIVGTHNVYLFLQCWLRGIFDMRVLRILLQIAFLWLLLDT